MSSAYGQSLCPSLWQIYSGQTLHISDAPLPGIVSSAALLSHQPCTLDWVYRSKKSLRGLEWDPATHTDSKMTPEPGYANELLSHHPQYQEVRRAECGQH